MDIVRSRAVWFALALAFAVVAALVLRSLVSGPLQRLDLDDAMVLSPPQPMPEVSLLDHRGEPVGREQLTGQWRLMFFGFTHCPDICPVTLQIMANVRAELARDASLPTPGLVFVSVDPARDDPPTLAQYLAHFGGDFLGLTGEADEIDVLTGALQVAVGFGAAGRDGHYDIMHTGDIFLLNPHGEAIAAFVGDADSDDFPRIHETGTIVRDLRSILTALQ